MDKKTSAKIENSENSISRITIDISSADHKKLKAIAAVLGRSMRDIINESIEDWLCQTRTFNKETLQVIDNIEKDKNLTRVGSAEELFKKLGI